MFMINFRRNRTKEYTVQITEYGGTPDVNLQAADAVMVHIYRSGQTPLLELNSWETEPGGSNVTFTAGTNDVCIRIAQEDVEDWATGAYDIDIFVLDDDTRVNGAQAAKHCETGVFFLHPSSTGSIADEQSSASSASSASS